MATETRKASDEVDAETLGMEPNWLTGDLGNYSALQLEAEHMKEDIYQQSDLIKPMMEDIMKYGLNYTYQKFKGDKDPKKYSKTSNKKHVIIVGAGPAGLSAAYELTKVGHEVSIVEMQNRVGGRIKTVREKDGFSKYCHSEAGAMRLPKRPDDPDKTHYLTDYYAAKEFKLDLAPFKNYDENCFLKLYDKRNIKISDWEENSTAYCDEFWKGWNSRIQETDIVQVKDIADYYEQTTNIVADQLKNKLKAVQSDDPKERQTKMATIWNQWINNWCKFSLDSFLQNTKDGVLQLLDADHQLDGDAAKKLDALIPWPDIAIVAYSAYTYTLELDLSLIIYLRDQLGKWWAPHMHCIADGMHRLPEAFITKRKSPWPDDDDIINLEKKTTYHVKVDELVYTAENQDDFQSLKVTVKGKYTSSGQPFKIEGDAVIITVPLHIVRQIRLAPGRNTSPPEIITKIQRSLDDIFQAPSTKVMLQYKERFWEKENIHGGFSKTNMPIGQLHYPTVDKDTVNTKRGILMSYTWKSEALMFAAMTPENAVREAVSEVARLHPGSEELFEVGVVQAWSNEPYSQGAYALLKPRQYVNIRFLMINPCLNMFFGGDGLSFAVGWIQGAMESGLRAAYQFYCRNEGSSHHQ